MRNVSSPVPLSALPDRRPYGACAATAARGTGRGAGAAEAARRPEADRSLGACSLRWSRRRARPTPRPPSDARSCCSTARTSISGSHVKDKSPAKLDRRRRRADGRQEGRQHRDEAAASRTISSTSSGGFRPTSPAQIRRAATAACSSRPPGPATRGYELQILDSFDNKTYVNGQAGEHLQAGRFRSRTRRASPASGRSTTSSGRRRRSTPTAR